MVEKQKMILPGENITTEEEYASGKNTFAANGVIKSKIIGTATFDDTKKEVSVKGKGIRPIRMGDIVTGKVTLVKESTVVLELLSAENGKKILGVKTAQLPVRNVSTEYVSELRKTMRIGDIVRAKITMASPLAIDLATNEKGLGVIKAYCSNCRQEMQYSNEKLMCLACGNTEERKWFEAEQKPREFAPREGGFRPREDGFRPRDGGFRDRGGSGAGHGRNFDRGERSFPRSNFGAHEQGHEGREARRQGQGFAGHQNKPAQRW
ncbi:MAG: exosome complex RNA-binding protein Csl4 [archaeon]|jgi:exosome complex RNA-binding protein Csl4